MPPGRQTKRLGEAEADPSDGQVKMKLARVDRGAVATNDFSSVVKSKLQSYTRTGQACDRCKVRKIRCDALPEGCSHCINQNLECYVTDRVTGRTERRGYMQQLEREKSGMLDHIRELEGLLERHGIEVKPYQRRGGDPDALQSYDSGPDTPLQDGTATGSQSGHASWTKAGGGSGGDASARIPRSNFESADIHLGVHSDQAFLSSIKGTTLSILGSTIDIGSFDAPDMDEPGPGVTARSPLFNKSIQALMQSATNINPKLHVEYPPKEDAFTYAEWYFLMIYPFAPILHKTTFMTLLTRLYDDPGFRPTVAQEVMVHMVFASIYLQYAVRNREDPGRKATFNELSNKHYHFAMSKFFDMTTSRTFADLQALTMIGMHTRSFPKPDCSGMMNAYCLSMAIEFGLHRAAKPSIEGTNLDNEMRKRLWWCILMTTIAINGRMGRPMPIRLEDIDAEFPEAIADEMLTEDGVDVSRGGKCTYEVGVACCRLAPLYLEMYSNLYSARRDPRNYVALVKDIESRLQLWQDELSDSLRPDESNESSLYALYVQWHALELRLCLRHPSIAMTNDPKVQAENTRICEQTAKSMLHNVNKQFKLKSIDTTWYALAVYIAAVFSTLAAHWERRYETTTAEVEGLRRDMNMWLVVLAEATSIIGSGRTVNDSMASIMDRTIMWIERDRQRRPSSSLPPQVSLDILKDSPQTPSYSSLPSSSATASASVGGSTPSHTGAEATGGTPTSGIPHQRSAYYPDAGSDATNYPPLAYADPTQHTSSNLPYEAQSHHHHQHQQYSMYAHAAGQLTATAATHPAVQAASQHAHAATDAHGNPLSAFVTPTSQIPPGDMSAMWRHQTSSGGNPWQDWTAAVVDTRDRYSSGMPMPMGSTPQTQPPPPAQSQARTASVASNANPGPHVMGLGGVPVTLSATPVQSAAPIQWPMMIYHDGTSGGMDGN